MTSETDLGPTDYLEVDSDWFPSISQLELRASMASTRCHTAVTLSMRPHERLHVARASCVFPRRLGCSTQVVHGKESAEASENRACPRKAVDLDSYSVRSSLKECGGRGGRKNCRRNVGQGPRRRPPQSGFLIGTNARL